MKQITVLTALKSAIISEGLCALLRSFKSNHLSIVSIDDFTTLIDKIERYNPKIVFIDPLIYSHETINEIRDINNDLFIACVTAVSLPETIIKQYDGIINIYDVPSKIESLLNEISAKKNNEQKELSPREKEIVIGVVKGLSNKEIAAEINISVHTVMTHRKNIASKLQIHSTAGLTIYAIVSKLIKLEDIKK